MGCVFGSASSGTLEELYRTVEAVTNYLEEAAKWTGELLTPIQVAEWLKLSTKTLQTFRTQGTGPDFVKVSRNACRYPTDAVQHWVDQRSGSSTAETNGAE